MAQTSVSYTSSYFYLTPVNFNPDRKDDCVRNYSNFMDDFCCFYLLKKLLKIILLSNIITTYLHVRTCTKRYIVKYEKCGFFSTVSTTFWGHFSVFNKSQNRAMTIKSCTK